MFTEMRIDCSIFHHYFHLTFRFRFKFWVFSVPIENVQKNTKLVELIATSENLNHYEGNWQFCRNNAIWDKKLVFEIIIKKIVAIKCSLPWFLLKLKSWHSYATQSISHIRSPMDETQLFTLYIARPLKTSIWRNGSHSIVPNSKWRYDKQFNLVVRHHFAWRMQKFRLLKVWR